MQTSSPSIRATNSICASSTIAAKHSCKGKGRPVTTRPGNLPGIQRRASSTEPSVEPLSHKQTSKFRKVCPSSEANASGKYGIALRMGIMTVIKLSQFLALKNNALQ
jgi:hypothetical protein